MPKLLLALLLAAAPSTAAVAIAAQTDPAKLATLKGERAANPRMQRCVFWLAAAEAEANSRRQYWTRPRPREERGHVSGGY